MNTNKHESVKNIFSISKVQKVVVSILEHTTQQRALGRRTKNKSVLKDNLSCMSCLSWLKNICVNPCPSVVPIISVYSVVKNGGAA